MADHMSTIILLSVVVPVSVLFGWWLRGRELRRPPVTLEPGPGGRDLN